jgi:D-glycero-alpha-D-manno-heptose-7-phosphate kinase
MVLTRSPLRISLGGGGTDLPSYYRNHGGFLISAAIDKYVFVSVTRPFSPGIYLKYSKLEHVQRIEDVQHPIIRECLALVKVDPPQIEITTLADIPAGTGLGSSGSFTTALLKALYAYQRLFLHPDELARLACHVEIERLKEPIGKQDQYIAAFGGITCFTFSPDESVEAVPLKLTAETIHDLEDNLLLFFTGQHRSASSILKDQDARTRDSDSHMITNLHQIKDLAMRSKRALEEGKCAALGELMHEHWESKKKRSNGITNHSIDEWYELGLRNGAIGGKVVGAGGGGFLLFYAQDRGRLRKVMAGAGLEEVRFRFDFEGTKVLLS